ncbi:hypothetical protein C3F36_22370 [Aeromonas sp. ASNIH2]|nr:hypothetical protein TK34_13415 [Aeromonas hydrophila]AUY11939.1 hypothetical protein C3F36_22370 [Aeromonas sp. ASNIH2]AXV34875.1 hypothetical protein BFW41_13435 [Aeromonas hydrophila]
MSLHGSIYHFAIFHAALNAFGIAFYMPPDTGLYLFILFIELLYKCDSLTELALLHICETFLSDFLLSHDILPIMIFIGLTPVINIQLDNIAQYRIFKPYIIGGDI